MDTLNFITDNLSIISRDRRKTRLLSYENSKTIFFKCPLLSDINIGLITFIKSHQVIRALTRGQAPLIKASKCVLTKRTFT